MSDRSASAPGKAVHPLPSIVIVIGVSGSGKSTIGSLLAGRLRWEFADADWFHPIANIDKMHKGIRLTPPIGRFPRKTWKSPIGREGGRSRTRTCLSLHCREISPKCRER